MLANRSMPRCTVIPELAYPDTSEAADWLCDAFGFTVRLRIGNHRTQLNVGDGAVVLTEQRVGEEFDSPGPVELRPPRRGALAHSVMVRVHDVHRHRERARQRGARILRPPTRRLSVRGTAIHRRGPRRLLLDLLSIHRGCRSRGMGRHVLPDLA